MFWGEKSEQTLKVSSRILFGHQKPIKKWFLKFPSSFFQATRSSTNFMIIHEYNNKPHDNDREIMLQHFVVFGAIHKSIKYIKRHKKHILTFGGLEQHFLFCIPRFFFLN